MAGVTLTRYSAQVSWPPTGHPPDADLSCDRSDPDITVNRARVVLLHRPHPLGACRFCAGYGDVALRLAAWAMERKEIRDANTHPTV
jgi:hypothetical protein